ncbi:winged helix-turn-helix transcriptional regulator [Nonomuraea sp. NPDC059194]
MSRSSRARGSTSYSLTESGAALVEVMRPLMTWADRWADQPAL